MSEKTTLSFTEMIGILKEIDRVCVKFMRDQEYSGVAEGDLTGDDMLALPTDLTRDQRLALLHYAESVVVVLNDVITKTAGSPSPYPGYFSDFLPVS